MGRKLAAAALLLAPALLCSCVDLADPDAPVGVDAEIWAVDFRGNQVLRFDLVDGRYLGPLIEREQGGLEEPTDVLVGPGGDLFVTSFHDAAVLRYDAWGEASVFFDDSVVLEEPVALRWHDDALYLLGNDTMNIAVLDPDSGAVLDEFGYHTMRFPHDFAFGRDGLLDVAMEWNSTPGMVQVWDPEAGGLVESYSAFEEDRLPVAIAVGPDGDHYVADWNTGQIDRHDGKTRQWVATLGSADRDALLSSPVSLEFGPDGVLYAATADGIQRLDPDTGEILETLIPPGAAGLEWVRRIRIVEASEWGGAPAPAMARSAR